MIDLWVGKFIISIPSASMLFFSVFSFLVEKHLFLKVGVVGSACDNVKQYILPVRKYEKREKLLSILVRNLAFGRVCLVLLLDAANFVRNVDN